ncbi:MAG: AAA family ATPase, partial [Gammaproteobacteria bacterium]
MSVPASERLITLAVYNPDLLNKEDLIRGFVARKTLLDRLLGDLRRETRDDTPPQPYLVLGQRGLGKTTLLRRLAYAIEDDPDLAAIWVPLVFPEEQYNIAMLSDFWLNCVDALGDAIERGGDLAAYRALDARVEGMPLAEPERRRQALELLVAGADRLGKRLMLLIDNIDIVFDRLGNNDDWEFRRLLSSEPRLLLIGASSRALEAVYDYGRPFYEYFQVHELKGLDEAETFELLQGLAEQTGQPVVAALLTRHPARVRTLRLLTGGNPRTLVVLFRILAQSPDGEVDRDLEQLLDLHTPLYKARFEELSTQAQQVVDAMAIHWDPLTAALLAEAARLPVNQVSAQLQRLEDSGVVEKTDWYGEKKTAYQIAERFFNIWYLMRASRRVRRKLIWLVKFLEIWFDQEELRTRAQAYLRKSPDNADRQRYAERAFAYAQAIKHRPLSTALEHAGLHALIDDEKVRRPIDFSDLPPELQDKRLRMERMGELHEHVRTVALDWGGIDREKLWRLLGGSPRYTLEEKTRIVHRLPGLLPAELETLFEGLQRQHDRILQVYRREAAGVEKLYDALAGGDMADVYDVEAA